MKTEADHDDLMPMLDYMSLHTSSHHSSLNRPRPMHSTKIKALIDQPAKFHSNTMKLTWDGITVYFEQYAKKLEGLLGQQGAGCLINEGFQQTHGNRGPDWFATANFFEAHRVSLTKLIMI